MDITYELKVKENSFGNGRDWSIILRKGNIFKEFWLGNNIKVVSRILHMRMDEVVKYYKEKSGSDNFDVVKDYIASDILREVLNTKKLTQEQLENAMKLNNFQFAVE